MVFPVYYAFICLICHSSVASAWDQPELEMFDLIEEMNVNFYEFFNIPKVFVKFFMNTCDLDGVYIRD